mgnify:CR=1 FL=1
MTLESRISRAEKRVPAKRVRPGVPRPANVMDFATNPRFLNVELFPVQGTILKVCTGAVDLLTDFDREVIAGWEKDWILGEDRGRDFSRGPDRGSDRNARLAEHNWHISLPEF